MNAHLCWRKSFFILFAGIVWLALVSCVPVKRFNAGAERMFLPEETATEARPASKGPAPRSTGNTSFRPGSPLNVTLAEATLMVLENNRSLVVERLNPQIRKTFEDQERAVFDPVIGATIAAESADSRRPAGSSPDTSDTDGYEGTIVLKNYFPSGTYLEVETSAQTTDSNLYDDRFSATRLGLFVTQPLLRGYGSDVNLARLRQSEIETAISAYELRGFVQSLIARVENAYWDYGLAQRRMEIVEESLKLARQQLSDTEEIIRVGAMAEAELAAVQAEVASQLQGLINAKSALETSRFELLRLLNPPGDNPWHRDVNLVHQPTLPEVKLDDVQSYVSTALRIRPEINQAKLDMQRGDLDVVRTRNGLLPRMDLFITLGKSGYADAFTKSIGNMAEESYDAAAGLTFEFPVRNRDAGARYRRAALSRHQAEMALSNLSQLVDLDVQKAYIEVNRSKEQIAASTATRKLQEEKLRIETEKFRVGRSTNFLVSQAQRDFLVSRINEVQAVVDYLKSLTGLYRLDGSLLERRGIEAPGGDPVEYSVNKD